MHDLWVYQVTKLSDHITLQKNLLKILRLKLVKFKKKNIKIFIKSLDILP